MAPKKKVKAVKPSQFVSSLRARKLEQRKKFTK